MPKLPATRHEQAGRASETSVAGRRAKREANRSRRSKHEQEIKE